jgi:hypothetical protein
VAVIVADKKGRPEHIAKGNGAGKSEGGNVQAKGGGNHGKGKK